MQYAAVYFDRNFFTDALSEKQSKHCRQGKRYSFVKQRKCNQPYQRQHGNLRYFADTIGTITQAFIGGSSAVGEVDGGGADRVAKIKFDAVGYKYLFLQFRR